MKKYKEPVRRFEKEFVSANTLGLELEHNGSHGGDGGHGGYVSIKFINIASGAIYFNGIELDDYPPNNSFSIRIEGSTERDTFLDALKFIVKELEENVYDIRPCKVIETYE